MQLWDVESGREKHEFEPIQHQLYCLAWHPTLNLIATGGPDGIVRLWDPSQKRPTHLWSAEKVIEQVRWSRDGKQLAAVGNHFYLSNLVDGRLEQEMKRWMGHMLYDVVQSPRGDSWAIANSSGEVRLWKDGRVTEPIRIASNELRSVRFSPGGISLVTCDGSGNVQFSDPSFHQSVLRLHQTGNQPRSPRAWHVAFSNDGTRLAACNAKGEIRIWSTTDTEK